MSELEDEILKGVQKGIEVRFRRANQYIEIRCRKYHGGRRPVKTAGRRIIDIRESPEIVKLLIEELGYGQSND